MKAAIFFADGFEESEGLIVVDMFRRAGIQIDTLSMNSTREVHTSHQVTLLCDELYENADLSTYDVLIMPGGKLGTKNLEACESLKESFRRHFESGKWTCAICAAPSILGHMGLLKGRKYTCFPAFDGEYGGFYQMELAVMDGNLITGRGMGATVAFAHTILSQLVDQKTMDKLEYGMQYEHTFRTLKKPE
jgi:DJ-1 family protein